METINTHSKLHGKLRNGVMDESVIPNIDFIDGLEVIHTDVSSGHHLLSCFIGLKCWREEKKTVGEVKL